MVGRRTLGCLPAAPSATTPGGAVRRCWTTSRLTRSASTRSRQPTAATTWTPRPRATPRSCRGSGDDGRDSRTSTSCSSVSARTVTSRRCSRDARASATTEGRTVAGAELPEAAAGAPQPDAAGHQRRRPGLAVSGGRRQGIRARACAGRRQHVEVPAAGVEGASRPCSSSTGGRGRRPAEPHRPRGIAAATAAGLTAACVASYCAVSRPAAVAQLLERVVEQGRRLFLGAALLHVGEVRLVRLDLGRAGGFSLSRPAGRPQSASRSVRGSPPRAIPAAKYGDGLVARGRPSTRSARVRRGSRGPVRPSGRRRRASRGSHFRRSHGCHQTARAELRDEAEHHDRTRPR